MNVGGRIHLDSGPLEVGVPPPRKISPFFLAGVPREGVRSSLQEYIFSGVDFNVSLKGKFGTRK